MSITPDQVEEILIKVLEERARVTPEIHGLHHEWVAARIEKEKALRDFYWSLTKAVAGWTVVGILGWLSGGVSKVLDLLWGVRL